MTAEDHTAARPEEGMSREWNWHPELPVRVAPTFDWPPRPMAVLRWFAGNWLPVTEFGFYLALAFAVWAWLVPPMAGMATLSPGWLMELWARNLVMFAGFATLLHLWLCTWKGQGRRQKYDYRDQARGSGQFAFRSQLWDNVMWGLASGVTIWTAYEAGLWWAYAGGVAPAVTFGDSPIWFVLAFPLVPVFQSLHFYWVHRLLHWPPLYRLAHAVHHRNVNVGPWSGFSMHPVEHAIYLSGLAIHLVVPTHPVHMLFHAYWLTLATATSHSGYENLILGERAQVRIGSFFHQLHHRYFECNYGNVEMPWDRWFGSHHDGSAEATARVRERRRQKFGKG